MKPELPSIRPNLISSDLACSIVLLLRDLDFDLENNLDLKLSDIRGTPKSLIGKEQSTFSSFIDEVWILEANKRS